MHLFLSIYSFSYHLRCITCKINSVPLVLSVIKFAFFRFTKNCAIMNLWTCYFFLHSSLNRKKRFYQDMIFLESYISFYDFIYELISSNLVMNLMIVDFIIYFLHALQVSTFVNSIHCCVTVFLQPFLIKMIVLRLATL